VTAREAEVSPPQAEAEAPEPPSSEKEEAAGEEREASSFELISRILTGFVGAIEDGTELLQATLREELARFREELERRLAGVLLLVASAGLITAGIALLLHRLVSDWAVVLLILGAIHLAGGLWLVGLLPPEAESEAAEEAGNRYARERLK
jgi:hypothetical protein